MKTPEQKTYVANAVAKHPSKRTAEEKAAILESMTEWENEATMKTTQHTLNLPLKLVYYSNAWEIREANNALVLHIPAGKDDIEAMAGAQFIVTACNSHYELLEALKEIAGMAETGRQTVSEIVGARVGNAGQPSRMVDSAAAITRGSFLSITQKALAIVNRAEEKE